MVVLADLERARHPASSLSRRSRPARGCCGGSESRRGLSPHRWRLRRGSECRKSLHTPGSSCIAGREGGGENIFEQINGKNEPLYLHHDQQGSTRLITGSTGTVEGKCTYGAYGIPTCEGSATTPLGYDGQYTNSDTGLIYLRAREYDPTTGQFLSVDPEVEQTHEAFGYAKDNALNYGDPTGKDSPAAEEIEFANEYTHVQSETTAALKRKHESSEVISEYREVSAYYYFAIKAVIASNDDNLEYFRNDQEAYEKLRASIYAHIAGNFAPLVKEETTTGWIGVIRDLAQLIKKLYHIHIVLRNLP